MSVVCHELHQLANRLPRHRFPIDMAVIPKNGIYLLFEAGELGHGVERIVRVGTHTGNNRMRSRLEEHFIKEHKDRSIFRKNIGRALLARAQDPFITDWELDLTASAAKAQYAGRIDMHKQQETERQVTKYIQENLSFVVLRVDDKMERLGLESKLISTVSTCRVCGPSAHWLGHFSPKDKIRQSGLWLVNELYKTPLTPNELGELAQLTRMSA
jgi:hypothetical protein